MSLFDIDEKIAKVVSVLPNKIKIEIKNIELFKVESEKFSVGSYLRVSDSDDCALICIIENYTIQKEENSESLYIIEAVPIGFLDNEGNFTRGGNNIAIPPTDVEPARKEEIQRIYDDIEMGKRFYFSSLSQDNSIKVPVNGDKFFNKHIAVVGSTGSGKSHTVAKILQEATMIRNQGYEGLNNSHIVLFDLHSEYHQAFPDANYINVNNLVLPYWLMNSEELQELFIDTEANDHNQRNVFKEAVLLNKKRHNPDVNPKFITYDAPFKFNIYEVLTYITNKNNNRKNKENKIVWDDGSGKEFEITSSNVSLMFDSILKPLGTAAGPNFGDFLNFISRMENKLNDERLSFLTKGRAETITFKETLMQFLGYQIPNQGSKSNHNITIIDLSGVPFEVLSITVSLISRIIFEFGYYFKKTFSEGNEKAPIMIVYEEAHKYVPKVQSAKYNSCRISIERIAKEGRKYGVTAMIVSQRPSEISETIFSQCNNFVAMRLTNPEDQNYVKRLLPDNLGPLTDSLPNLKEGDAILLGDAIIMPSLVTIDRCNPFPSSNDILYLEHWKKEWLEVDFKELTESWTK
ncbi:ATP-binding protein [Paenibacillus sp. LK1]|uniref:ATP-binding protein n=1 Tax=Paenibacillus sp. LK1 TaxID=2053014 RepID=UPI000C179B66|nr:ATP-binding protein [Paenibacillus sp. LK1]PIH57520.1 Bipolar DNA helicase [Paenibacillus sp. LK1]